MNPKTLGLIGLSLLASSAPQAQAAWIAVNSNQPQPIQLDVLTSSPEKTVLKYTLSGIDAEDVMIQGRRFVEISIPDANPTEEEGLPALPRLGKNFVVPASSQPELKVVSVKTRELKLGAVAPSKGSLTRDVNPASVPYTFSAMMYGAQAAGGVSYPVSPFQMTKPFSLRKIHGVNVTFFPVQYDPASESVSVVTEAIVEIDTPVKDGFTFQMTDGVDRLDDSFLSVYEKRFANFGLLEQDRISHFIRDTGRMLVISHPQFVQALAPFVQWKLQRGMQVSVVTTDEAGKTAANIKKFIQSRYQSDQISYVLLVGDSEFVPYHPGKSGNASGAEADPMYGLVDGNDGYPDLVVSRFSVKKAEELAVIVQKSVAYERDPDLNGDWYSKASGIASSEGSPTDYERADVLRGLLGKWHYTSIDQIYEPSARRSDITKALSEGRSFINYIGHGSKYSWGTTGFSTSDVKSLSNVGKLPFIVSVACVNGQFGAGDDSFAEAWLKAGTVEKPTGAIAIFASSTNQSWVPPTVGQKVITELLTQEKYNTIGTLFFHGSIGVLEDNSSTAAQTFETWHIFGDGSLQVRTKKPVAINAQIPAEVPASLADFEINAGEKGIQAGIVQDGVQLGSGVSGDDGMIRIKLKSAPAARAGALTVTLTGFDKIPTIAPVAVAAR